MLGTYGIIAMSPELGIKNGYSDDFFISDPFILKSVIQNNSDWIMSAAGKVRAQLQMSTVEGTYYRID